MFVVVVVVLILDFLVLLLVVVVVLLVQVYVRDVVVVVVEGVIVAISSSPLSCVKSSMPSLCPFLSLFPLPLSSVIVGVFSLVLGAHAIVVIGFVAHTLANGDVRTVVSCTSRYV